MSRPTESAERRSPHRRGRGARARAARAGFSAVELVITMIVGAIVASLSAPTIRRLRDAYAVRAARQEMIATIEAARAAAVQRGHTARFFVKGDTVLAVVDTAPPGQPTVGTYVVRGPLSLNKAYNVTLTPAANGDTMIAYDARGLANPRLNRTARVRITAPRAKDSVCVSNFGQLLPKGCSL